MLHLIFLGNVRPDGDNPTAKGFNIFLYRRSVVGLGVIRVVEGKVGSLFGKGEGDRFSNTAA